MTTRTRRQTQIIEESLALINEEGMEGLTYRNLSERFGISIPAFYRHFASKADVLLSVLDYLGDVSRSVYQSAQETGTDPLHRLERVLVGYAEQFAANSALTAVLFPDVIGGSKREFQQSVLEHMSQNHKRLTVLLADGMSAGLVRTDIPAERWALVIMAVLRLEVTQWRLDGRRTDLVARVTALWADLQKILRPAEARTGRTDGRESQAQ